MAPAYFQILAFYQYRWNVCASKFLYAADCFLSFPGFDFGLSGLNVFAGVFSTVAIFLLILNQG